jgi:hypothetical protein
MKTRFLKPVLLAAAASLALAACATSTPYQPVGTGGARGGYAEQRLENDRFRVSFSGNSVTSREQVEMGLLLRSAELTKQNGFDWFATVNRATDRDTRYQTLGAGPYGDPFYAGRYGGFWGPSWRFYGRGSWSPWGSPWGRGWGAGVDDWDVRQIDRYEASSEIVMGKGAKPASDPNAFDAGEVIANLGPRVTRAGS